MSLERREAGGRPSAHNARRPGARGGRGGALGRSVRAARRRGGPGTLSGPEGRGGGVQVALEVGTLPDVAGVKAKSLGTLSLVLVLGGMWSLNCQE